MTATSAIPTGAADWTTHTLPGGEPAALLKGEWLLTNGLGGYAMGTAAGRNDRRYHGLLVAAQHPPVGRVVALNQVVDELHVAPDASVNPAYADARVVPLATLGFADQGDPGRTVFSPAGFESLQRFERGTSVAWVHVFDTPGGSVTLRKTLTLHWRSPAATLHYETRGLDAAARLRLRPLLTLRDFHAVTHAHDGLWVDAEPGGDAITARLGDVAVTLGCGRSAWRHDAKWWYAMLYELDRERGQESTEDAFAPGYFDADLADDRPVSLTVALGETPAEPRADAADREAHLAPIAARLAHGSGDDPALPRALAIAADDFVVRRTAAGRELSTILAGYPWFADWGRDTFIALPGLLLCTGRHEEAREALEAFASAIRNGLIPNRFDDYGQDDSAAHYNTVDASLWYVHAALEYLDATGDAASWNGWLAEACVSIVDAYIAGADHRIAMTADGLVTAGDDTTQLTWMDAACGGVVFTPRHGKAVEINALWHHALAGLAETLPGTGSDAFAERASHYAKLAARAKRSFLKTFWDDDAGRLVDHVTPDGHADRSVRPNQVFACSLARSPLAQTRQKKVVATVGEKLLTPMGLRTLPEDDPRYHPHYTGHQMQRDEAYHQGTVWGWLIGPYAEAVLRCGKFSPKAKKEAAAAIQPLLDRLLGEGLGQLAEIFEAQPDPRGHHRPVGCMAQAWSVAEVVRVWVMAT